MLDVNRLVLNIKHPSLASINIKKTQKKQIQITQTLELSEARMNATDPNRIMTLKLNNDEQISNENLLKIILLQQEEIKILRGKNYLLSQKIEQLNYLFTNRENISKNKSSNNKNIKILSGSEPQKEKLISISKNFCSEKSSVEIKENEKTPNYQEFKLEINLNELLGILYLDLPDLNLKLEKNKKSNKLPIDTDNKEFEFMEMIGILTNMYNNQLYDFKLTGDSTTDGKK